jgi:D-amino-acid dehydrogenase
MSAIVVGGGLMGVTTAHELQRRGISTTLVEARDDVALETSFANGSMLTPSMSDPWNAPGVFGHLVRSLGDPKAAIKLRPSAFPSCISWGLAFLRNANAARYEYATRANFFLARYSLEKTRGLRDELHLEYHAADHGTMKMFRNVSDMTGPVGHAEALAPLGLRFERLGSDEAVKIEPALGPIRKQIAGALFFPDDGAGNAHLFCRSLANSFLAAGGQALFGHRVVGLDVRDGKVKGVRLADGKVRHADVVIIAAGEESVRLARQVGINLPIEPVKGYSLTFSMPSGIGPAIPVIDDALHAAVVPVGDKLRIAGTAEIAGHSKTIQPARIDNLFGLLEQVYPDIARKIDRRSGEGWTGLRPMSADGLPFIGASAVEGLFVNSGHGHLGWTCAAGSAAIIADLLCGRRPDIDPEPFRADR